VCSLLNRTFEAPPVFFAGNYEHTIDAKNRLAIPADIRARWRPEEQGLGWYALPWTGNIIRLYPERDFEVRAKQGILSLTPDEDESALQAALFGLSKRLEMDNAGRIMLPDQMLRLTNLPKDITIVGCNDRLELHDRTKWNASVPDMLQQLPELIARLNAKKEAASRRSRD
jgi:MraZ protein